LKKTAIITILALLCLARPLECGLWYWPETRVVYPVCIMEGPECRYWLTAPGGEIRRTV